LINVSLNASFQEMSLNRTQHSLGLDDTFEDGFLFTDHEFTGIEEARKQVLEADLTTCFEGKPFEYMKEFSKYPLRVYLKDKFYDGRLDSVGKKTSAMTKLAFLQILGESVNVKINGEVSDADYAYRMMAAACHLAMHNILEMRPMNLQNLSFRKHYNLIVMTDIFYENINVENRSHFFNLTAAFTRFVLVYRLENGHVKVPKDENMDATIGELKMQALQFAEFAQNSEDQIQTSEAGRAVTRIMKTGMTKFTDIMQKQLRDGTRTCFYLIIGQKKFCIRCNKRKPNGSKVGKGCEDGYESEVVQRMVIHNPSVHLG